MVVAILAMSSRLFTFSSYFFIPISQTPRSSRTYLTHFHSHHQSIPIQKSNLKAIDNPKPFSPSKIILIQCRNSSSSVFSIESRMLLTLLQEYGIDEKESEVLFGKNPDLRFTSFDYARTRILSLQSVGISGLALYRLITKCPDVLTADEIEVLINFVRDDIEGEIEPAQFERFLGSTEPRFLVGFDKKVMLLVRHGIVKEKLAHVLNNINLNKVFCLKSYDEIEKTLVYLDRFNGAHIIVKRPMILHYDLDTSLIPKIEFLTDLNGGDEIATGTLLRKLPAILSYSLEHLEGHVELFRSFAAFNNKEIFDIFLVFPNVISASKKRKLYPRIEFLKQCGLNSNDIYKFLIKAPLFLGLSFEDNLAVKLTFLVKIGFQYRTKDLTVAVGALTRTSSENLQKVIGLFLDYGLLFDEILVMAKKHPQILQYKFESLEQKMNYLIEGMGRQVDELLSFPAFLGYNLDDRIKHRYEVRKEIIGEGMSLNKLLSVSTERFGKGKTKKAVPFMHDLVELNVEKPGEKLV